MSNYDIIIIGTGAGGATMAYSLASSGKKILILERGPFLPKEEQNWDPSSLFIKGLYLPKETWFDKNNTPFTPGTHYFVGGNTKFYGAALLRLREADFNEINHYGGRSLSWPLAYEDFKPYYLEAEKLYQVHGARGKDPTEPWEKHPYFYPEVSHEPFIQAIFEKLQQKGFSPFPLPLGIRLNEKNPQKSLCIRCSTCDGYPCKIDAKSDAHRLCIEPILARENITLLPEAKALRLNPDNSGKKIVSVEVEVQGKKELFSSDLFIISCGAINSAALFLRSKTEKFPQGLANSSDLVGRNYMCHNNSAIIAISTKKNPVSFQKTLGINDFYHKTEKEPYPLGHIQLLGKVKKEMLEAGAPFFVPKVLLEKLAQHSVGWWITSEDLPDRENRVQINSSGNICLHYNPNNLKAHKKLLKKLKSILNEIGGHLFHFSNQAYLAKKIPLAGVAHQVGTMRFGRDPKNSVLNLYCKTHDLENAFVVDGSFFPSSGAVNPALTIIANSLRVAEYIKKNY